MAVTGRLPPLSLYSGKSKGVKASGMSIVDKVKTEKAQKVHKDWYKLDLSAIVYPTLQRRDFSSVYRLSVLLKEEIDPEMLQRAVNLTMPRFPTYKAAIRKGVFWRYLEPNDRPGPFVQEDVKNPCQPMYFKANNRYLVRIYYYRNRIALEAHHSLGDGTGGMCVLQTLTAYSPGGMLNAFAWPLTYSDQQRASIVYRADYQGI